MSERGRYIVIEGGDGTGKSEQVRRVAAHLSELAMKSIVIEEPDGFVGDGSLGIPPVGFATELRKIIKNGDLQRSPMANVLAFTAARVENWQQAIQPALEQGAWVLAARNWISTLAYQGYGEGVNPTTIYELTEDMVGQGYMHPDLTLVLALEDETERAKRIANRGELEAPDTFESKPSDFQARMQDGYRQIAAQYGFQIVDAGRPIEVIEREIWQNHVQKLLQ